MTTELQAWMWHVQGVMGTVKGLFDMSQLQDALSAVYISTSRYALTPLGMLPNQHARFHATDRCQRLSCHMMSQVQLLHGSIAHSWLLLQLHLFLQQHIHSRNCDKIQYQ